LKLKFQTVAEKTAKKLYFVAPGSFLLRSQHASDGCLPCIITQ